MTKLCLTRCAPALAFPLLLLVAPAASPQAKRKAPKAPSIAELAKRIRDSRSLALSQRFGVTARLTRLRTEAARRASLALLETEEAPAIRARLVEHVAPLGGLDKLMRGEFESTTDARGAATAARYILTHSEEGRRMLLDAFDRASGKTQLVQRQAVVLAFGDSAEPRDHKVFAQRAARLEPKARTTVLLRSAGKKGEHFDALRRKSLTESHAPLRGAALQQLCAQRDPEAIRLARQIADDDKRDAGIQYSLVLALFSFAEAQDLPRLARVLASSSSRISSSIVDRRLAGLLERPFVGSWALQAGTQSKESAVQSFALRILEKLDGEDASDGLFALTQSKNAGLRRRAIFALAKRKDRRVLEVLEEAFEKGGLEHRIDALEGLALVRGKEASFHELLLRCASSGAIRQRLVALDIAARLGVRRALELLPRLLREKDWRLRSAGIQLARDVRAKSNIPPLLDAMAKEKGRLVEDARRALASLTRLYYHQPKDWQRWWKREGKSFTLPPPEEKKAASSRSARAAGGGGGGAGTSASFYGIPVLSERVVYCVDVSGSMSAVVGTGMTRLKVAQEALISALKSSPKRSRVNVIFFESRVHPYARESISLRRKSKLAEIQKFTRRQKPRGGTNIHGALLQAMEDEHVDTIFLLSDGAPSGGAITNPNELVEDIVRRNRSRRIVFHCISIGSDSAMLRRLAEETGGRYSRQ